MVKKDMFETLFGFSPTAPQKNSVKNKSCPKGKVAFLTFTKD